MTKKDIEDSFDEKWARTNISGGFLTNRDVDTFYPDKELVKSHILQSHITMLEDIEKELENPSYIGVLDSNEKRRGYDTAICELKNIIQSRINTLK